MKKALLLSMGFALSFCLGVVLAAPVQRQVPALASLSEEVSASTFLETTTTHLRSLTEMPLVTSLSSEIALPTSTPAVAGVEARVVQVIDGDTIEVELQGQRHRVRYIGIDAPEDTTTKEPFGAAATKKNRELVEGKTVLLEKDVSETDRYGRLLRYVWLGDLLVNAELVRLGYAQVTTYPPDVKYQDLLLDMQREAREAGRGLWTPAVANVNANLRAGPGTHFPRIGGVKAGDPVEVVARNAAGDWYLLANGAWIYAELVDNAPEVPVAMETPTPPAPTATPTPVTEASQPSAVAPANCDPSYPTVCIPPPPPDLDCRDVPYRRFRVVGADPHRFDGDHDGIGCER